jgi:hypothetical protein
VSQRADRLAFRFRSAGVAPLGTAVFVAQEARLAAAEKAHRREKLQMDSQLEAQAKQLQDSQTQLSLAQAALHEARSRHEADVARARQEARATQANTAVRTNF